MCIHIYTHMYICVCSVVSDPFATPWTVAHQAPPFMGFSGKSTGAISSSKEIYISPYIYGRKPLGFLGGSDSKESSCYAGVLGSIPGLGSYPGEGNGNPLQYSCLENSMDRGACGLQSMVSQRVGHKWAIFTSHIYIYGKESEKEYRLYINKKYAKVYIYIYIYIYVLFQYLSVISYYKILSIVPCTIQWVFVGYIFYIQ